MINVIIDTSGSMALLGKPDIVQSLCRELMLTENADCEFYKWDSEVSKLKFAQNGIEIKPEGKVRISPLCAFINERSDRPARFILLTDGFVEGDKGDFTALLRNNQNIQFRVIGLGADCSKVRCGQLFPKMTADEEERYIFSPLELNAALESFDE